MKSTKFHCVALPTKYISKTMDMMISSWLLELIIRNSCFNNYSGKLFCQAIKILF